jgi:ribosomal protein L32
MSDQQTKTSRERLRINLVQALTHTESDEVEHHLRAALEEWENQPPTPLQECPICGKAGLPERIKQHECGGRV